MIDLPSVLWPPPAPAIVRPADRTATSSVFPGMTAAGMLQKKKQGGLDVTFLGHAEDTSTQTEYTFPGFNLGAAAADRHILVAGRATDNAAFVSGAVGGVGGALLLQTDTGSFLERVYFFIAAVPTGTSGTITFDNGSNSSNGAISAWRLTGLLSTTPVATSKTTTSGGSLAAAVSAAGALFGAASMRVVTDVRHAAAWRSFTNAEASHAITATRTAGTCFTGLDEEHNTLVESLGSNNSISAGVVSLR